MGWFNRGKKQEMSAQDLSQGQQDLADLVMGTSQDGVMALIQDRLGDPERDVVTGSLDFDDQMRVSGVSDLTLNGAPFIPGPDDVARANEVFGQLLQLPQESRYTGLSFEVAEGGMGFNLRYPD